MKIRLVGAEFFYSERQTDAQAERQKYMTNVIFPFRDFENVFKKENVNCKTKTFKGNHFLENQTWLLYPPQKLL